MESFYREAGKCTDANGMIQWKKVKGCLQETLTTVECNRQCTAIRGKYHPLSVWKQKGYDVDEIEKKADRKESDMLLVLLVSGSDSLSLRFFEAVPIASFSSLQLWKLFDRCAACLCCLRFGFVYKVATLEVSMEHVSEEVRTKILKAERKLTKSKKSILDAMG